MAASRVDKEFYRNQTRVDFSKANADDPAKIRYKLFTRKNPDQSIVVTVENVHNQNLNKDVKTIVVMHGWTGSDSAPWYGPLKDAYLQECDYNIIYVDWSVYGNLSYSVSSANVKPVGEFIAGFLEKSAVPPEKIHLIGHSLGSQLSAFIGKSYEKQVGRKIGRITALDPAGPKWGSRDISDEERLSNADADFVDVIHTDIQFFGFTLPCGHVDFYPNGGADQPGCPDESQKENCSHQRSAWLFIESVHTKAKTSTEIDIEEDQNNYNIILTKKAHPRTVVFGEHVDPKSRGVYYLATKDQKPFLENS